MSRFLLLPEIGNCSPSHLKFAFSRTKPLLCAPECHEYSKKNGACPAASEIKLKDLLREPIFGKERTQSAAYDLDLFDRDL